MCAGAIFWAGIGRLVHGVSVDTLDNIYKEYYPDAGNYQLPVSVMPALHQVGVDVNGPYLEYESAEVVRKHIKKIS